MTDLVHRLRRDECRIITALDEEAADEIERLSEINVEMLEALKDVRDDLLMRAPRSDPDGTKVVDVGVSVWLDLNDAIAKAEGKDHG